MGPKHQETFLIKRRRLPVTAVCGLWREGVIVSTMPVLLSEDTDATQFIGV
ncbi:MAG: hypothetical protein GXP04_00745 [Alphaproteobacteria bacterium]|nr:hypothetical protein [Alphaproteobacteria bacterium]